jgi:SAM-dependent methyltransferase
MIHFSTARSTSSEASRALWTMYQVTSPFQRSLAALRPYICPVAPILDSVQIGTTVLDIGCGNGLALSLLARFRHIECGVGVEISPRAVAAARQVSAFANLPLTYLEAPTFDCWPDEMFDAVTMIDVLHHVPKKLRRKFVLTALDRVANGGRFVYKDMTSSPWWRVAWNAFHDLLLARQLVHVEPIASVVEWAASAGFQPTHTEAYSACAVYGHELVVFERNARTPAAIGECRMAQTGDADCGND